MSRVWRLLPPRKTSGELSRMSTLAPARLAVIAAQSPALPPPITRTSKLRAESSIGPILYCVLPRPHQWRRYFSPPAAAAALGRGAAGRSAGAMAQALHEDTAACLAAEPLRVGLELCPARFACHHGWVPHTAVRIVGETTRRCRPRRWLRKSAPASGARAGDSLRLAPSGRRTGSAVLNLALPFGVRNARHRERRG